jgi:hypothetical protein
MFELELVAQVCRDLSKKPGWGKREVVGKKGALRAGAWNGWRPSELFLTIQNAIPTTVSKHADTAHREVLHHQGEFPETQFEMNTFNRIWQSEERIKDWMMLRSQGERYEAVSALLNTCRSFLLDFGQSVRPSQQSSNGETAWRPTNSSPNQIGPCWLS